MGKLSHLILKRKWWDQIERGEKKVEYRRNTPYWRKRIFGATEVVFHRGYTKTTMRFKITHIVVNIATGWIEVHLGERLE